MMRLVDRILYIFMIVLFGIGSFCFGFLFKEAIEWFLSMCFIF